MSSVLSSLSLHLLLHSALHQIWSELESVTLCSRSGSFYYSLKLYCHTEGQEVMLVDLSMCVWEGGIHQSVRICASLAPYIWCISTPKPIFHKYRFIIVYIGPWGLLVFILHTEMHQTTLNLAGLRWQQDLSMIVLVTKKLHKSSFVTSQTKQFNFPFTRVHLLTFSRAFNHPTLSWLAKRFVNDCDGSVTMWAVIHFTSRILLMKSLVLALETLVWWNHPNPWSIC